jgi:hypothetical protein
VKAQPGFQFNDGSGCALGMAVIAIGGEYRQCTLAEYKGRTGGVEDIWTWLDVYKPATCGCFVSLFPRLMPNVAMSIRETIAHLFDNHVFGKQDWTLDQLIDWVRSVEPTEAAPQDEQAVAESCIHAEVVGKINADGTS